MSLETELRRERGNALKTFIPLIGSQIVKFCDSLPVLDNKIGMGYTYAMQRMFQQKTLRSPKIVSLF